MSLDSARMVLMGTIQHGTASGYTNGKCRCEECKRAHREAAARYKKTVGTEAFNDRRRAKYAANPEPTLEAIRRWRAANPEKVREMDRQKYLRHREHIRERERAYYVLHQQEYVDRATRWREANPEKAREHARNGHARNRDRNNAYAREHAREKYAEDPQKYRDRFNAWAQSPQGRAWFHQKRAERRGVPYTEEALEWLESLDSPLCTYCGEPATSIDHIVPISRGGTGERENLTPACGRCNSRKNAMSVSAFLKILESERQADG